IQRSGGGGDDYPRAARGRRQDQRAPLKDREDGHHQLRQWRGRRRKQADRRCDADYSAASADHREPHWHQVRETAPTGARTEAVHGEGEEPGRRTEDEAAATARKETYGCNVRNDRIGHIRGAALPIMAAISLACFVFWL